jgi:hypothetical protein
MNLDVPDWVWRFLKVELATFFLVLSGVIVMAFFLPWWIAIIMGLLAFRYIGDAIYRSFKDWIDRPVDENEA